MYVESSNEKLRDAGCAASEGAAGDKGLAVGLKKSCAEYRSGTKQDHSKYVSAYKIKYHQLHALPLCNVTR